MSRTFTVPVAARMYQIPLVDFCAGEPVPDRWGVLIASGSGLMMSVMDQVAFRWCVDVDALGQRPTPEVAYRLAQFITMANVAVDGGVAMAGWFSITDPEPLRKAFAYLDPPGVVYAGDRLLGVPGEELSLRTFLATCHTRWDPFTPSKP